MKKIIFVLLVCVLGFSLVSCFSENAEKEPVNTQYSEEELSDGVDYPGYEESVVENEKKKEIDQKVKEENLTVERGFLENCEHNYIEMTVPIEGLDYFPVKKMCTNCGGSKIISYVKNDFETQPAKEAINELVEKMHNK